VLVLVVVVVVVQNAADLRRGMGFSGGFVRG
jgi:hypothetical protein